MPGANKYPRMQDAPDGSSPVTHRVHAIVGHFGSGKTEFAVNYVMDLKKVHEKAAILDMDIANPYFRSRERKDVLEALGIEIYFNTYGYDINEDLPAITAQVRAPLENKECVTVVDVGGNDSGARIINQFRKYFLEPDCRMLAVVNANRPDTETAELAIGQIRSIEEETGILIDGLINNTHMLRETETGDILTGFAMCRQIAQKTGKPVVYNTCVEPLLEALCRDAAAEGIKTRIVDIAAGVDTPPLDQIEEDVMYIYPLTLQMRPEWLDREI